MPNIPHRFPNPKRPYLLRCVFFVINLISSTDGPGASLLRLPHPTKPLQDVLLESHGFVDEGLRVELNMKPQRGELDFIGAFDMFFGLSSMTINEDGSTRV